MPTRAAPITLRRYTHTLPDAMERARRQLDAFIDEAVAGDANKEFAEVSFPLPFPR